jgi:hypothetical protein
MNMHKIVVIGHWGVFFGWFYIAILTHSMIDLIFASAFLYILLQRYPVFKTEEEKNDSNTRLG